MKWVQWELEDTGRAELPLDGSDETYAAGIALDLTSQKEVQLSESLILPPSPLLLLYSDHGVLCPFTMINKNAAAAVKLKELVKPAKPLPSDPRLVRQPKQASGAQGSPPAVRPSSATTTGTASATSSSMSAHSKPAQQQQPQRIVPPLGASGPGLNLTPQKSPFSQPPGGLGKGLAASPLSGGSGGLAQPPSFGQPPSLGQLSSSLGRQSPSSSQPLSIGQPSPLLSQLSLKSGGPVLGSSTGTPQQQPRQQQSSGIPLLGGSGIPGSGLVPSSFPFSASSLASTAASSPPGAANKPSPQLPPPSSSSSPLQQQQLLQHQQQKKQSPLSHPQSSLPLSQPSVHPPAAAVQASGTTIGGLRFAPGYLSHVQQTAPPVTVAPLLGQQLSTAPGVGMTKTIGLTSSAAPPPPSSLVSQLPSVSGVFQPSIPPSQASQPPLQHLPVKPLHSSTPLAHPAGLHPQPRPLPPHLLTAATTVAPPPNSAAMVQPSPLLNGTSPLSVHMAAPKPVGNTQGGPSVASMTGQPRPVAPSTAYQSPQVVGVRPSAPLVQKQPPPAYGYGAPPPTSVGGASAPPRTTHHPPPPPSNADDTEVLFRIVLVFLHIECEMWLSVHTVSWFSSPLGVKICHLHSE